MPRVVVLLLLSVRLGTAAVTALDLARQIQQVALDPGECYRVAELNFTKEDVKVYLTSGYLIFSKPIAGFRHAAVFVTRVEGGDAEVLVMPPVRSERYSLAAFTESPNLDEHFKSVVFIFTDQTAASLLEQVHASAASTKSQDMGDVLAGQWTPILRNLSDSFQTRLVYDLLSEDHKSGLFYMAVTGNQLGNFDILYEPGAREQIFAGKLVYRDNRTYFDTWTSFESRSVRNGASALTSEFKLDDFRIEAALDADLKMKAITRATLTPKKNLGAAIPFFISSSMRVTAASIDGQPAEVFTRESLRSNLIAGNDNQQFLLIPATPIDPGKPHEVEVQHEGEVVLKAGSGVYYVAARGTWYPRLGIEFSTYDLTFRYPGNLTLVATGTQVEDRTDASERVTRYKTESPIRYAGFNLGEFESVSITQGPYKVDVYANRKLESALQPKPPAPASILPPVRFPRPGRPPDTIAVPAPMPPPDPKARIQILARDVAGAMDFMAAMFGPPPIRNLAVAPIPGTFGQGFPGLVYLSTLSYIAPEQRPAAISTRNQQTFFSELLDVHEVAHQWWGNTVIPASYQDDWLMESLANYSALMFVEKRKGIKALEAVLDDYRSHLLSKSDNGRTLESAGPITWGYRLQNSLAPGAWRAVTYEKGTWIVHMLRRRLGDEKFSKLLREVCDRYRFSAISTEQFRELAAQYTPPKSPDASLKSFFENWVYGTGVPAVKLAYAFRGTKLSGTISQRGVADDFAALVPVEVQAGNKKTVFWLPTGSDPIPFSIPMKLPPGRVSLLANDCLLTSAR